VGGIPGSAPPSVIVAGTSNWPVAATIVIDGQAGALKNMSSDGRTEKVADLNGPMQWNEVLIRIDFERCELRFTVNGEQIEKAFPFRNYGVAFEDAFRVMFGRRPNTDSMWLDSIRITEVD
jgi:hypothetical protein